MPTQLVRALEYRIVSDALCPGGARFPPPLFGLGEDPGLNAKVPILSTVSHLSPETPGFWYEGGDLQWLNLFSGRRVRSNICV